MSAQLELERRAQQGDVRAQVQLGLLLERAGHANAGMEWLSIAAQRNDAEALMLVGCRLVAGRYGPSLVRQGVDLLIEASAGGNSEAAILLSRLSALGMHLPQSWIQALNFLVRAAELGNVGAQQELLILAGRSADEAETRWTSPEAGDRYFRPAARASE